jgi:hypothetical protein
MTKNWPFPQRECVGLMDDELNEYLQEARTWWSSRGIGGRP